MSSISYAVTDSATMLRRNLRHAMRYPALSLGPVGMPVILLLLFVGLFGRSLGAGIKGGSYIDYVTPGILLMSVASGVMTTSVGVSVDMTKGIINRFRTMAISRVSLLTGHVLGGVLQIMIGLVLVVGVAMLMGFRPDATAVEWVAAAGLMLLLATGLTWVGVALGLLAKNPEGASNTPLLITFLPFLSSTFVPPETMPAGVRWFAENQPFTAIIETLRGLLLGSPIGNHGIIAAAWCAGIGLAGYLWSRSLFKKVSPAV